MAEKKDPLRLSKPKPSPKPEPKPKPKRKRKTMRAHLRDGTAPKPVGRPRTTLDDLPDNWQELVRLAAQEGHGPTNYMVILGITSRALETLLEDYQEFRDVFEQASLLCRNWWEDVGRKLSCGQIQGSGYVWRLNMANRFRWTTDRSEVLGDASAPIQIAHHVMSQAEVAKELRKRKLPTRIFAR